MTDQLYSQLRKKYKEVYAVKPNDLHFHYGTKVFKRISPLLKEDPFIFIVPLSVLFALSVYLLLQPLLIRIVSILQYGF